MVVLGLLVLGLIALAMLSLSFAVAQSVTPPARSYTAVIEPITPIPDPPVIDPLKVSLGEKLFNDFRLSRENTHSCASCHDTQTNGAGNKSHEVGRDGSTLEFNTPTVFNAALSFRFSWKGKFHTLQSHAAASLQSPQTLGLTMEEIATKLTIDPAMRRDFAAAYGQRPNADNVVDAIVSFERTLVTPGSKFDRWLKGDVTALSAHELQGYGLFKSLGCVSCHQGVNVGGNLFEQRGIFAPLTPGPPDVFRVPSLRNIAVTAPYFHNGSSATLDDAVRKMARAQLNATLADEDVSAIVAFLQTLTGEYHGAPVRAAP
jgi:cytochrome c peroxidase